METVSAVGAGVGRVPRLSAAVISGLIAIACSGGRSSLENGSVEDTGGVSSPGSGGTGFGPGGSGGRTPSGGFSGGGPGGAFGGGASGGAFGGVGGTPATGCFDQGRQFDNGEAWTGDCNDCGCVECICDFGAIVCSEPDCIDPTQRACRNESPGGPECVECRCSSCIDEWLACAEDPGCNDMLWCMDTSDCSGPDCFLSGVCPLVSGSRIGELANYDICMTSIGCRDRCNPFRSPIDECFETMFIPVPECAECICQVCADEWNECTQDPGCARIRECAVQTACAGSECYQPAYCQSVVDDVGGPFSASASLALNLDSCYTATACGDICNATRCSQLGYDTSICLPEVPYLWQCTGGGAPERAPGPCIDVIATGTTTYHCCAG